jgi:hypothetical protein
MWTFRPLTPIGSKPRRSYRCRAGLTSKTSRATARSRLAAKSMSPSMISAPRPRFAALDGKQLEVDHTGQYLPSV